MYKKAIARIPYKCGVVAASYICYIHCDTFCLVFCFRGLRRLSSDTPEMPEMSGTHETSKIAASETTETKKNRFT